MGIFKEKSTFAKFREKITNVIVGNPNLDEDFLDELEESLMIPPRRSWNSSGNG